MNIDLHESIRYSSPVLTFQSQLITWCTNRFNIQQLCALPTLYLCVLYLSEHNGDLCHLQQKLTGFYNRVEKCLQRGTNWVFKYSGLHFVFKKLRDAPTV